MRRFFRSFIASRYVHLVVGLMALYGVSEAVTYTDNFEKIVYTLKRYCLTDYHLRDYLNSRDQRGEEYRRERYRKRLLSLTNGLFDPQEKVKLQTFFQVNGYIYDSRKEKRGNSYLLARIIKNGHHEEETPEKVAFDYAVLGRKEIEPFQEYDYGNKSRVFATLGDDSMVYVHMDSIEPLLGRFFDFFWDSDPKGPESFKGGLLTYSVYRDLKDMCEEVLIKRIYRDRGYARNYFIREGFEAFLPTILTMGGRMVSDQDLPLSNEARYRRALLTGFAQKPNYTMFFLFYRNREHQPATKKLWDEFSKRTDIENPEEISLEKISHLSRDIFNVLEGASTDTKPAR